MSDTRTIRYLAEADVQACLPPIEERLKLASDALIAVATREGELPQKIGVHPREGAVVHAMPAFLPSRQILGLKWVSTYPQNPSAGLRAIDALVVLNDAETGRPTYILDGALITAVRTAAVSGVAIRLYAPDDVRRVAILGSGVQGRSHAEVVAVLLPGVELRIYDRHAERARAFADEIRGTLRSGVARAFESARDAVVGADIVISAGSLGSAHQVLAIDWLSPDAVVISIDADTYASAELARSAYAFVVDDRDRFLGYLREGAFKDFPEPTNTLGEAILQGIRRDKPGRGRVLACPLGIGLADVVLADAIRREAEARGVGTTLTR